MPQHNPFEILTFIVAPAILTNASSLLALGTSNRFARVVDRSRFIHNNLKAMDRLDPEEAALYRKQLPVIGQRSLLLVRSLTSFYFSVGSFAATAFVSLLGAGITLLDYVVISKIIVVLSLCCGLGGVLGLVIGTGLLMREMWLAFDFLKAEVELSEGIRINPVL